VIQQQEAYCEILVVFFGVPPIVIAKTWELIEENETLPDRRYARKKHLLWALHYMKQYPDLNTLSTTVKFDDDVKRPAPKTVTKWVWILVSAIANLDTYVIKWENRKINDVYNDCLVSVDGIDCKFQQMKYYDKEEKKYRINKALGSYKFKYAGLRYEVALALSSNHIVWINGPFLPGDWVDIAIIFRQGLVDKLDENERVEADDGYRGEAPKYVRCPCSMECVNEPDTEALQKTITGTTRKNE